MYLELQQQLGDALRAVLKDKYDLQLDAIPIEIPPDLQFGELATPIAFELARKLRKAPKIIAQEIVAALGPLRRASHSLDVAGAGYINARLDRAAAVRAIAATEAGPRPDTGVHCTRGAHRINPNKAAHVGHLRNAILGDTFVRLLRAAGQKVDVQNYIDNTGVQVADVVVGFLHLEGKSLAEVRALVEQIEKNSANTTALKGHDFSRAANAPQSDRALAPEGRSAENSIDYYCWDLYAKTSQWYTSGTDAENEAARKKLRYSTLHAIEHGGNTGAPIDRSSSMGWNETAEIAELISTAVLRRHLETMLRLDIEYDFLPRESEILHLKFWEAAFEQLKQIRRPLLRKRRQEQRLLGHDPARRRR